MKTRIVVVALIEKDGKILMGNKAKDVGPYPNTWRLPGGGVEEGESLEEAMKREIKEETTLETVSLKKIAVQEDNEPNKDGEMTHYTFHQFRVKVIGTEETTEEFPDLIWVPKAELNNVSLSRPSITLFKKLGYM